MVNFLAAVGFCCGVWYIELSTRVLQSENRSSVGMLASIFGTNGATSKWCGSDVFQRQRGVAIDNGNHGEVVFDWNSYGNLCGLEYCHRGTAGKLSTFRTIFVCPMNKLMLSIKALSICLTAGCLNGEGSVHPWLCVSRHLI